MLTRARAATLHAETAARVYAEAERASAEALLALNHAPVLVAHVVRGLLSGAVPAETPHLLWEALLPIDVMTAAEAAPLLARFEATRDDGRGFVFGHVVACRVADNFGPAVAAWSSPMRCYHSCGDGAAPLPRTKHDVIASVFQRCDFAVRQLQF